MDFCFLHHTVYAMFTQEAVILLLIWRYSFMSKGHRNHAIRVVGVITRMWKKGKRKSGGTEEVK